MIGCFRVDYSRVLKGCVGTIDTFLGEDGSQFVPQNIDMMWHLLSLNPSKVMPLEMKILPLDTPFEKTLLYIYVTINFERRKNVCWHG